MIALTLIPQRFWQISWLPLTVGLALSMMMVVIVLILFRGEELSVKAISNAGILKIAWFFARSPAELMTLTEVDVPNERDLRRAGDEIRWKGAAETWDKESL
jgi:hypothetical protein